MKIAEEQALILSSQGTEIADLQTPPAQPHILTSSHPHIYVQLYTCRVFSVPPCPPTFPSSSPEGGCKRQDEPDPPVERPSRQWLSHHTILSGVGPGEVTHVHACN